MEFIANTGSDEKVKYDASDPTAGYVADKIVAGTGISVAEGSGATENKLVITNSNPTAYTLPTATDTVLGGVKIGARLTMTGDVLSADVQAGSGAVDSVNGQTGDVVLDADDISDTSTTNKFVTATDKTNIATLTNDSMADALHRHSELSASDGTPNPALSVDASGNVGIGTTSPTAYLHLKAGTATANTAPLKFTSGVLNTVPVAGQIEFDGSDFYLTI